MDFETRVFISLIEDQRGIIVCPPQFLNGTHLNVYIGLNNRRIFIDTSYDDIDEEQAKDYLRQLGLDDLISILFTDKEQAMAKPEEEPEANIDSDNPSDDQH